MNNSEFRRIQAEIAALIDRIERLPPGLKDVYQEVMDTVEKQLTFLEQYPDDRDIHIQDSMVHLARVVEQLMAALQEGEEE